MTKATTTDKADVTNQDKPNRDYRWIKTALIVEAYNVSLLVAYLFGTSHK